ncbi:MAG TPA: peptidylprolyl isomerase [Gemmatimonadales bacterium]|nr:peptidylprolyl isomerase [Gemmatimonadales bacterium]
MRRSLLLVGTLAALTGACDKPKVFTASPDIAAKAADQELSAQRVADILTSVKGIQLTPEAANFVANLWVDYSLFAQALADGTLETDSTFIREAMWPAIVDIQAGRWHDSLVTLRATPSPEKLDSAYKAGTVRVLQHILVRVEPSATPAQREAARKKADGLLAQVKGGTNFGALALTASEDPSAVADSGFLPPSPKGAWAAAFDSVGWTLEAGQVSEVVPTEFGFHVIRRADEGQAKQRMQGWLQPQLVATLDSTLFAELDQKYAVKMNGKGIARMKVALDNLDAARDMSGKIVDHSEGGVTIGEFARWVRAATANPIQGPQTLQQLKQAPDSVLTQFALRVAQGLLFLKEAQDAKIDVTPEEWTQISAAFKSDVDSLKAQMQLGAEVLDSTAKVADRKTAAGLKVEQFFDRLTSGQAQMRVLPGMLAWTLRGRMESGVNAAGTQRAIELAQAKLGVDTTAAPPAPLQPAPGGPPVGGGAPAPAPTQP